MSSSKARASASVCVEEEVGKADTAGFRAQADSIGSAAVHVSLAIASRRVNKESNNGCSMNEIGYTHCAV
jgi:hypothetical protein